MDAQQQQPAAPLLRTLLRTPQSHLTIYELNPSASSILRKCVADVSEHLRIDPPVTVYGRSGHQHRDVGFFSDVAVGYAYSGQSADALPLTSNLAALVALVNAQLGASYNGVLVNHYKNGLDYIGPHSDDESGLDPAAGVACISFGETRTLRIRNRGDKQMVQNVATWSGQMLVMGGDFQREFTHEIPQQKRVAGGRYSFTFRAHKVAGGAGEL